MIIGLIETLGDGVNQLPSNVIDYLAKNKFSKLKKLANEYGIKYYPTTTREDLVDTLSKYLKSRPYTYLTNPKFKELAIEETSIKQNKNLIFIVPQENFPKKETKMKKKLKDPSELKRMNLIKYQAIVMKFIQNLSETDPEKNKNKGPNRRDERKNQTRV